MARGPIKRPVFPRDAARLPFLSMLGAVTLFIGACALYFAAGWTDLASPGPLTAAHSTLTTECAQCHTPRSGVADLRCERCHDPIDSRRFGSPAHALAGAHDRWNAARVPSQSCASCHVDHRGHAVKLRTIDDSQCATCHRFSRFSNHPEFAVIRAQAASDIGLQFSHAGHLKTLEQSGDERCEACHRPAADRSDFEPIAFDTDCARCHIKNGALTINGVDPAEANSMAAELLRPLGTPRATVSAPDGRGRQKLIGMPHADPWLLDRVARMASVIDPAGEALSTKRARIEAMIRESEAASGDALADMAPADLRSWADALRTDLEAIDAQQASTRGQLSNDAKARLDELAALLEPIDAALPGAVGAAARIAPPVVTTTDDDLRRAMAVRRDELVALLDAIDQRADARGKESVAALRTRLQALTAAPAGAAATPADEAGLWDRLRALEGAIATIEAQAGATAASELRRAVDATRRLIVPGSGTDGFAARKAELSDLLDAIDARADALLKRRVAELRSALADLAAAGVGDEALARRRADKVRLLDRITLQLALATASAGPTPGFIREERASARSRIKLLQSRLNAADSSISSLPPLSIGVEEARKGIQAILYACSTCHRVNPDGSALMPVRASLQQLPAARFIHKPHIGQARCETCHAGVETSVSGADTLLPAIATCQSCHNSRQAGATCASCHTFHPRTTSVLTAGR